MLQFKNHIITHNAVIWYFKKTEGNCFQTSLQLQQQQFNCHPPLYTQKTQFLNINLVCTLVLLSQATTPHNWKLPKSSRTLFFFVIADSDQVCQLSFYFCSSILLLLTLFPRSYFSCGTLPQLFIALSFFLVQSEVFRKAFVLKLVTNKFWQLLL